jgi:hypothetical protein
MSTVLGALNRTSSPSASPKPSRRNLILTREISSSLKVSASPRENYPNIFWRITLSSIQREYLTLYGFF